MPHFILDMTFVDGGVQGIRLVVKAYKEVFGRGTTVKVHQTNRK